MSSHTQQTLGECLRSSRVSKGLGLRQLAAKLAITPSYLSDIETDRRIPSEDVLQSIASLLELEIDDLMARAGRLGDEAERYLRQRPEAAVLFRKMSQRNLAAD